MNKPTFGNKPMATKLSQTTKSALEKAGPVATPRSTYEAASVAQTYRSTKQYDASTKESLTTFNPARNKY